MRLERGLIVDASTSFSDMLHETAKRSLVFVGSYAVREMREVGWRGLEMGFGVSGGRGGI